MKINLHVQMHLSGAKENIYIFFSRIHSNKFQCLNYFIEKLALNFHHYTIRDDQKKNTL